MPEVGEKEDSPVCGGRGRDSDVLCGGGGSAVCVTLLGSVDVVVRLARAL